jgi:hypothetical protein
VYAGVIIIIIIIIIIMIIIAYILVGKPEGKGPLGWPRRRWEDNIKKDLKAIGC